MQPHKRKGQTRERPLWLCIAFYLLSNIGTHLKQKACVAALCAPSFALWIIPDCRRGCVVANRQKKNHPDESGRLLHYLFRFNNSAKSINGKISKHIQNNIHLTSCALASAIAQYSRSAISDAIPATIGISCNACSLLLSIALITVARAFNFNAVSSKCKMLFMCGLLLLFYACFWFL